MNATQTSLSPRDAAARNRFLTSLLDEALAHPALNHPWLTATAAGSFQDPAWALRDYAWHYHGYSSWFPYYLKAVIANLTDDDHRALLRENLEEEQGHLGAEDQEALREVGIDPATVDGVPHPELFRRFCRAMGLGSDALADIAPATRRWRNKFRRFLENASPAAAVGALGLGTESVVKPIYQQLLAGIQKLPFLSRQDYVFFELHCLVDDQHQEDLLAVAGDLCATQEGREQVREGMLTALDLRTELWNVLHQRAQSHRRVSYA